MLEIIVGIFSIFASISVAVTAYLVVEQLKLQRRNFDIANLLSIERRLDEKRVEILNAVDDEAKFRRVLSAHIDYLEVLARIINSEKLDDLARNYTFNLLKMHIGQMYNNDTFKNIVEKNITTGNTYMEIRKFLEQYRDEILQVAEVHRGRETDNIDDYSRQSSK